MAFSSRQIVRRILCAPCLAVLTLCFLALGISRIVPGQQLADSASNWFTRRTDLPKDIFDLPYFDGYRQGGSLDVQAARAALEGNTYGRHLP